MPVVNGVAAHLPAETSAPWVFDRYMYMKDAPQLMAVCAVRGIAYF